MGRVALYGTESGAGWSGDRVRILDVVQCSRPLRCGARLGLAGNGTLEVTMEFTELASISGSEGKCVRTSRDPYVDPHGTPARNYGVCACAEAVDTATVGAAKARPATKGNR